MEKQYCVWRLCRDDDAYETSCENMFQFMEGGCRDNKFMFCPYCGKPIIEKR